MNQGTMMRGENISAVTREADRIARGCPAAAAPMRAVARRRTARKRSLLPSAPVFIPANRYDPFTSWVLSHPLTIDWCDKGADVQLWTNEQPLFLNKMSINHLLHYLVNGERGMQWVADRFNGMPTSPNCAEIRNEYGQQYSPAEQP